MLKLLIIFVFAGIVRGHGRLARPPSRSSAWQFGFSTPINYNDWQLNCGGYEVSQTESLQISLLNIFFRI